VVDSLEQMADHVYEMERQRKETSTLSPTRNNLLESHQGGDVAIIKAIPQDKSTVRGQRRIRSYSELGFPISLGELSD